MTESGPSDEFSSGVHLPEHATPVRILGVDYIHVHTEDDGDLYITKYGVPYLEHLRIRNWLHDPWFRENRERLRGTSTVYRVRTKAVSGRHIDLVVKWSRVGEDVPLDTASFSKFAEADFNSPYEEFALLTELREDRGHGLIRTNRPLAIYVPAERLKLWQTGRARHRIRAKLAKYADVELDILRQYVLIYEWVKGESADQAMDRIVADDKERAAELRELTNRAANDLLQKGFRVIDHKPAHIILRSKKDGEVLRDRSGKMAYALVDFELLMRTEERQRDVQELRRSFYLKHQRNRFKLPEDVPIPENLASINVRHVDYLCGEAESTHGVLWVVGRDPALFDFFLPERWRRTPRKLLSARTNTYYTLSKDDINLVWKVSRVGERPPSDEGLSAAAIQYGFNSPFEEFDIALALIEKGVHVTYPRAIYSSGLESPRAAMYVVDHSRYASHKRVEDPEGHPILRPEHSYITIWGYWNGLDEMQPSREGAYGRAVHVDRAVSRGVISEAEKDDLLQRENEKILAAGFQLLQINPRHFLLSVRNDGSLVLDEDGYSKVCLCNCELIRRLSREENISKSEEAVPR